MRGATQGIEAMVRKGKFDKIGCSLNICNGFGNDLEERFEGSKHGAGWIDEVPIDNGSLHYPHPSFLGLCHAGSDKLPFYRRPPSNEHPVAKGHQELVADVPVDRRCSSRRWAVKSRCLLTRASLRRCASSELPSRYGWCRSNAAATCGCSDARPPNCLSNSRGKASLEMEIGKYGLRPTRNFSATAFAVQSSDEAKASTALFTE